MDQVQCAILKTFENTVKVLMENNRNGYDSSSLDNIFEQLQGIRQSVSELSARMNRMEMKCNCNMDTGDNVWDTLPWPVEPKNIIIQGKRDIPDIFESAPIPLCPSPPPKVDNDVVPVPVPVEVPSSQIQVRNIMLCFKHNWMLVMLKHSFKLILPVMLLY